MNNLIRYQVKIKNTEIIKIVSFSKTQKRNDVIKKFTTLLNLDTTGSNNEYIIKQINCKTCTEFNSYIHTCGLDNTMTKSLDSCIEWKKR